MIAVYVNGHFEIISAQSGEFISSADTWDEAMDEIKEVAQQGGEDICLM